jgi:uncharacterized protein (TIGR02246 family)
MDEWEDEILGLFADWNRALQTGRAGTVTSLYASDAVLIPTRSNKVCDDHLKIEEYFEEFLKYRPSGELTEPHIRLYGAGMAANSGLYTFRFAAGPGGPSVVRARYTFVYERSGPRWLIAQHHSSVLFGQPVEDAELMEMLF